MSIDDLPVPSALTVDVWRSVLHDVIDDALDQILLSAESEWGEPPGDPPDGVELPDLSTALRDGLAAEIARGIAFWGCDGTLRCARRWAEEIVDQAEPLLDTYRRQGILCDCAVLHHILGRAGPEPGCPRRQDGPSTGSGSWPWS